MDERDSSFLMMLLREEITGRRDVSIAAGYFLSFPVETKGPKLVVQSKDVLKPRLLKKLWSLLDVIALISIKYPIYGCVREILISGDFLAG